MQHRAIYAANFNALHISKHNCANVSHISTATTRYIFHQIRSSVAHQDARRTSELERIAHLGRDFSETHNPFLRSFCRSARLYKEPSICRSAPFCASQANALSVPFCDLLCFFELRLLCHFTPFQKSSFCAILRLPGIPLSVPFCAIFCACFYINSRPIYMERLCIIRRVPASQSQKRHPIRSVSAPLLRSILSRADCWE